MNCRFHTHWVPSAELQRAHGFLHFRASHRISPTPTGRNPGHLSTRLANNASKPVGSTNSVTRRLATDANAFARDAEVSYLKSSCARAIFLLRDSSSSRGAKRVILDQITINRSKK